MKVICIIGKARSGKDFVGELIKDELEAQGKRVIITHYGDLVKYVLKNFFGWNGEKDEAGRRLLQTVGTDIVRKKDPNFWVDFLVSMASFFGDKWDYMIIPDTRFFNEITKFEDHGYEVTSIRVVRPVSPDHLEGELARHPSETSLDNFLEDITIINDVDEDKMREKVKDVVKWETRFQQFLLKNIPIEF